MTVAAAAPAAATVCSTSGRSLTSAPSDRARGSEPAKDVRSTRIAAADSGRSSRSGSVALATKPSRSAPTSGADLDGFGTRSDRCLYAIAIGVSPVYGSSPVSSSYATIPSE